MKFNAKVKKCNKCGEYYDLCQEFCTHCHSKNNERSDIALKTNAFWVSPLRQVGLFLTGFALFNAIALFTSFILKIIGKGQTSTNEELIAFLNQPHLNMFLNVFSYMMVFIVIIAIMYPFLNSLFAKFKNWKTWAWGVGGGVALIIESMVYSLIISQIIENEGNANQQNVVSLIQLFPLTSILAFGIVGPLVEEFTYRVGAFTFFSRINRVAAYVITMIIFGLIHFDFSAIGKPGDAIIIELINLPNYIIAGCMLCFIYERSSWAGSSIAHMVNNLYATFTSIILYNLS